MNMHKVIDGLKLVLVILWIASALGIGILLVLHGPGGLA